MKDKLYDEVKAFVDDFKQGKVNPNEVIRYITSCEADLSCMGLWEEIDGSDLTNEKTKCMFNIRVLKELIKRHRESVINGGIK